MVPDRCTDRRSGASANTEDESDTELICGRLKFHAAPDNLIIAALPAAIVLRLGPGEPFHRMRMLVQAIDEELEAGRPGATAVAEDLASALFVMMDPVGEGLVHSLNHPGGNLTDVTTSYDEAAPKRLGLLG
jgi:hypothetical protein